MRNVILSIPDKSWEILRRTLELNARSKAFDQSTRDIIAAALGTVMHIGDDVSQIIDQCSISGYGIGEGIQNLQVVTGLLPEKDTNDDDDNEDPPGGVNDR